MFNIYINDGKTKIPDNEIISYIISKNGIFLKRKLISVFT